ncbi:MAG TPA: 2-oxoglutarate dehydrogenase, E2 component, dihydrolipoamide succinyltransferase [Nocardioidaceae bacterium]|nr:2-oxoglutarate dehydrogenase, E2 component, dihydrolipoamide succinyltransferase [Nocardioidaceae bacterium]
MSTEVNLPALGESVTEGTVTQWLKAVGDSVAVDEPLLEVSTDKVDTEVPSPVAGVLLEIKAAEDETVEVGAVLAVIGDEGESAGSGAAASTDDDSDSDSDDSGSTDDAAATEPAPSGGDGADTSQVPTEVQGDEGAREEPPSEQAPAARAEARPSGGSGDSDAGGGDSTDVTLPALGESVTEGTVTSWLKSVGDEVAVDEPLLEVSTDKVDTEVPSPVAGTLLAIKVDEDETVEVGAVLAVIGSAGSAPADEDAPAAADAGQSETAQEAPAADEPAPDTDPDPEPEADARPDTQTAEPATTTPEPSRAPEPVSDPAPSASPAPTSGGQAQPAQTSPGGTDAAPSASSDKADSKSYVTPLVRKLAAQHSVDLSSLSGTGVGGRIRKQDVLEAAEAAKQAASAPAAATSAPAASSPAPAPSAAASPLRGKTEKLSRLRKVIAARMVESLQVSAQLTTVVEVDVTAISRLRDRTKEGFAQREGVKLSFLPFFARAAIDALKAYPQVNASIDTEAGEVTYHDGEHLGVAVDTERGLLVPVIRDAGDLSIAGLARKIADLAARTRDNKISPDELSGGTFTLTNTGSRGALFDTPIINQPQVAILGTGSVVKRPVVISDERLGETIAVRQMVYLALTYDHRLVDGADAARFLGSVKHRLEEANFESELGA